MAAVGFVQLMAAHDPRWPAATAVLPALQHDAGPLAANTAVTMAGASVGLIWGGCIGFMIGAAAAVAERQLKAGPALARIAFTALVALQTVPVVVLAPAISASLDSMASREVLAAVAVVFPIASLTLASGRASAAPHSLGGLRVLADLVGAPPWRSWLLLDARRAADTALAGLRIGVPAAMLGSLVAEFFGADHGLGVFVLNSLVRGRFPDVWASVVWVSGCATVPVVLAELARRQLRWSAQSADLASRTGATSRRWWHLPTAVILTAGVLACSWCLGAVALGPGIIPWPTVLLDWAQRPSGEANVFAVALAETTWHWMVALGFGLAVALPAGLIAWWSRPLRRGLLALLVFLRSTPLLVLIPVVAAVLGRGFGVLMTVGALTSLLPTTTVLLLGLEHLPEQLSALARSSGARPGRFLWFVVVPHALTSLRSALPLIVPLTLEGVVLAEWLATGDGLGTLVVTAQARLDLVTSWTAAAAVVGLASSSALALAWNSDRAG
jgi:sulfonate transport system permease protein